MKRPNRLLLAGVLAVTAAGLIASASGVASADGPPPLRIGVASSTHTVTRATGGDPDAIGETQPTAQPDSTGKAADEPTPDICKDPSAVKSSPKMQAFCGPIQFKAHQESLTQLSAAQTAALTAKGVIHPDSHQPVWRAVFNTQYCDYGGHACYLLDLHLRYAFYFQWKFIAFHHMYGYVRDYVDIQTYSSSGYSVQPFKRGWNGWDPAYYSSESVVPYGRWHVTVFFKGFPYTRTITAWATCYASGNCYPKSVVE